MVRHELRQKTVYLRVPVVAQWVTNLTSIHEDTGSIPGLAMWVQDLVSLWLRSHVAVAVAVA